MIDVIDCPLCELIRSELKDDNVLQGETLICALCGTRIVAPVKKSSWHPPTRPYHRGRDVRFRKNATIESRRARRQWLRERRAAAVV